MLSGRRRFMKRSQNPSTINVDELEVGGASAMGEPITSLIGVLTPSTNSFKSGARSLSGGLTLGWNWIRLKNRRVAHHGQ